MLLLLMMMPMILTQSHINTYIYAYTNTLKINSFSRLLPFFLFPFTVNELFLALMMVVLIFFS